MAIGGGSTVGLGKAIALESGLPILAIPTTYAGSEMTPIYGLTEAGLKKTGRDARVSPRTVLYDPELTLSLPVAMSVTSGLNAIAHAAEGLYAQDSNPVMDLMAEEGIRALAQALPSFVGTAVTLMPVATLFTVPGCVALSLGQRGHGVAPQAVSHPGRQLQPATRRGAHGGLPQAIAFNATAAPKAMTRIERALGVTGKVSAAAGLFDLAANNGAPVALRDIGMKESDLDRAAHIAVSNPYWNPRPLGAEQRSDIRDLLHRAYEAFGQTE
ncbi:MAG: iron-containing alcohol dehydrogenase [Betaproteobacteria bacterium]|nr:iron-containing alcohol dehydrogenase [Betaproteobacteria bacterium]